MKNGGGKNKKRCGFCGRKIEPGTVHLSSGGVASCEVRVYGKKAICQICERRRKLRPACGAGVCTACDASFVADVANCFTPMVTV